MALGALEELAAQLREFANARDWEQFHTPKNLAMALSVEASELLEHFQWLTPEESQKLADGKLEAVSEEMADVLIYLVRVADVLGVDLLEAARSKIALNERRYPVDLARGRAGKVTD